MTAPTPATIAAHTHPLIPEAVATEQRARKQAEREQQARDSRLTYRIADAVR